MSRSTMLDFCRRTMGSDYEPEGVYEQDPDEEEWKPATYDGEWRYVNLGPQKVAAMLETETNPEEKAALSVAHQFWMKAGGYSGNTENLGWVHRGDDREIIRAAGISELGRAVNPVSHVMVRGLSTSGVTPKGEDGVIDLDVLGPIPPGEVDEIGLELETEWNDEVRDEY